MKSGERVHDRYGFESLLGSGGFAEVWSAIDSQTGARVAVKIARASRDASGNASLREEAAILGQLDHPNIVRLLDSGTERGRSFLVLELVTGPTLREALRESGQITDSQVRELGAALADALAASHALGLVHGDVKPENIILTPHGPRLIDFGSARDLSQTMFTADLREMAGTLAYIAPERLSGGAPTPQADIYGLGITLYEARSGRLPFIGSSVSVAGGRMVPLRNTAPGVAPQLESAIMQTLASDPAWRPASAAELAGSLWPRRHDTVRLRPQKLGSSRRDNFQPAAMASTPDGDDAVTFTRGPGTDRKRSLNTAPVAVLAKPPVADRPAGSMPFRRATAAAIGILLVGAGLGFAFMTREGGETSQLSGQDDAPNAGIVAAPDVETITAVGVTAQPPSPTLAAATPAATAPTASPVPTSTAVPPSPTSAPQATVPPPTPAPVTGTLQDSQARLDSASGSATVVQWYKLVTAGRFDSAYALWSESMKARYPRQGNLDGRWANTAAVSVNSVRVVSEGRSRMTVAIDFVETLENGSTHRFAGTWQLVPSPGGWLLDRPNF